MSVYIFTNHCRSVESLIYLHASFKVILIASLLVVYAVAATIYVTLLSKTVHIVSAVSFIKYTVKVGCFE